MSRNALALSLILGAFRSCECIEAVMGQFELSNSDPLAVCNDGSSAMYYFRRAQTTQQRNIWLIYLGGGGWCFSASTCAMRYNVTPGHMSSRSWATAIRKGGILDDSQEKNPAFSGANKVFIEYCSSDSWIGDVGVSAATFGLSFRGWRIFAATLASLVQQRGMGADGGIVNVVLAGCDTGGTGAVILAPTVAPSLAALGLVNTTVQVIADSILFADVPPLNAASMSFQTQAQAVAAVSNASTLLAAAGCTEYPWQCLIGQYSLPSLLSGFLLYLPQFDKRLLSYELNALPPFVAPAQTAYMGAYQQAVLGAAGRGLAAQASRGGPLATLVYSPACAAVCVTQDGKLWSQARIGAVGAGPQPLTFQGALYKWWSSSFDGVFMDNCTGFNCGRCQRGALPTQAAVAAGSVTAAEQMLTAQSSPKKERSLAGDVHKVAVAALMLLIALCMVVRVKRSRLCDVDGRVRDIIMQERMHDPVRPPGKGEYGTLSGRKLSRVSWSDSVTGGPLPLAPNPAGIAPAGAGRAEGHHQGGSNSLTASDSEYRLNLTDFSR